ncbi:MAG: nucleotidyltransferase domain-containing protein [Candidatus Firestonebacteria bacterium]|nr:nucleotidyltransferase domain-containing protein [Candidatus Firestonebacteria bacterium]
MIKLTQLQKNKLQDLNVSLVYLFGSYAEEKSMPSSDIDIGVAFFNEKTLKEDAGKIYNELYFLFSDIFIEKSIDIVFLQNAGLELRFDVIGHGKIIYQFSYEERLKFEDQVNILYMDFKPLLKEFNQAILNRI